MSSHILKLPNVNLVHQDLDRSALEPLKLFHMSETFNMTEDDA